MGCEVAEFYRGIGCRRCRNTGYSGRIGIHELLPINDELRDAIVRDASIAELRRLGTSNGLISLPLDGFHKVREGITTVEEILPVAGETIEPD
jgi:type IV pilus assembly protein PilB